MINDAMLIFINDFVSSFRPKGLIFLRKVMNIKMAVTMAQMLVAGASPPMPMNLARMMFKTMLMATPICCFNHGCFGVLEGVEAS